LAINAKDDDACCFSAINTQKPLATRPQPMRGRFGRERGSGHRRAPA
jgi:hypothetical protein